MNLHNPPGSMGPPRVVPPGGQLGGFGGSNGGGAPRSNDDSARLDKIARVLSKRSGGTTPTGAPIFYGIDRGAKALLLRYADELACAALEGAQLLAQHRGNGKRITLADMQLILAKKNNIEVHGLRRAPMYIHPRVPVASGPQEELEVTSRTKGVKRKYKNVE